MHLVVDLPFDESSHILVIIALKDQYKQTRDIQPITVLSV